MFKFTCSVGGLVLALLAFAVSPAGAAIHIESCMKEETECKTASVGTTFKLTSKEFFIETEKEKEVLDKCNNVSLSGKVTDPTSEKAGDPLSYSITAVTYSECSSVGLKASNLPWTVTTDEPTLKETGKMEVQNELINTSDGCAYVEVAPNDLLKTKWESGKILDEGYLKKELGSCLLPLWWFKVTYHVSEVSDPNLAGATGLVVH
jgi:hypothetical protein